MTRACVTCCMSWSVCVRVRSARETVKSARPLRTCCRRRYLWRANTSWGRYRSGHPAMIRRAPVYACDVSISPSLSLSLCTGMMHAHVIGWLARMHARMHACRQTERAGRQTCSHAYVHPYTPTHMHTGMQTCIHTCIHTHLHTCVKTSMHTCIGTTPTQAHTHTHTHTHSLLESLPCSRFGSQKKKDECGRHELDGFASPFGGCGLP